MSDKDFLGIVPMDDDVTFYPVDEAQLRSYWEASDALSRFQVPRLVDAGNPRERLFIAAFDGTGNDQFKDPLHATNIARLDQQLGELGKRDPQIHINYLTGPGTQDNAFVRNADLALGYTYENRLEQMYSDLTDKANEWYRADPDVQIGVLSTGFSRGGSQAAGFTNLLHERGIVDLDSRTIDAAGNLAFTRHIAAPGRTLQAIGVFDPVATGLPETYDRRLAPSVVSGFQMTMQHERRVTFISDRLMPMGVSEDGRSLNVMVAAAHSDGGGGYLRDGLARRSFNVMSDYINALRPGAPMLQKVYEPDNPKLNVIHNSHEGMPLYQLDRLVDRTTPEGVNTRLAPSVRAIAGRVTTEEALPHGPQPLSAPHRLPMATVQIARPPSAPSAPADLLNLRRIEAAEAAGIAPLSGSEKMANFRNTVLHGAGRVAVTGVVAHDVADAGHRYAELRGQGNLAAAQSALLRAGAQSAGGLAGFEAGAIIGSPLGPGALATGAIGAVVGTVAGDLLADEAERRRVYTQRGSDGNTWQADPDRPEAGWTRKVTDAFVERGGSLTHVERAKPEVADELNFKAVAKATEFAMAAATARDPFTLPASKGDTFSAYGGDWQRNALDGTWQREINFDKPGLGRTETADAARQARLDTQAKSVIAANAEHSPIAMAETFKAIYDRSDWRRHGDGALPDAIAQALDHPERVVGSDGNTYVRQADREWKHDGLIWDSQAKGNLRAELDLAYEAQRQPGHLGTPKLRNDTHVPTLETVHVTLSPQERIAAGRGGTPDSASQRGPDHEQHPDHALLQQIRGKVRALGKENGMPDGEAEERVSRSLLAACKDNRDKYPDRSDYSLADNAITRADHIVAGRDNLFVVQGKIEDPAHLRAHVNVAQAMATPVERSDAKLESANQAIRQEQQLAFQQSHVQSQQQDGARSQAR